MKVGSWFSEYSYLTSLLLQPWKGILSQSCWQSHGSCSTPSPTPQRSPHRSSHTWQWQVFCLQHFYPSRPWLHTPLESSFKDANHVWSSCSEICNSSRLPRSLRPISFLCCVSFLGLQLQSTTNWAASGKEMHCLRILEARNPRSRCWQSWFLLRVVREILSVTLSQLQ